MLGAGIGMLLADRVPVDQRSVVGRTLVIVGALTIPLLLNVIGKSTPVTVD